MVTTAWPFIELDEEGIAFIRETRTKVTEIAACHTAYRWDADQIHLQLSGLTLPQIHAALGFYYEHKPELDLQMCAAQKQTEELKAQHGNPTLIQRLREKKVP